MGVQRDVVQIWVSEDGGSERPGCRDGVQKDEVQKREIRDIGINKMGVHRDGI